MPIEGEYEPSPWEWSRNQVAAYEATGGKEGGDLNGKPVVILTTRGRRSGKLRKSPLMRVEHDGRHAGGEGRVVAALRGGVARLPEVPGVDRSRHPGGDPRAAVIGYWLAIASATTASGSSHGSPSSSNTTCWSPASGNGAR
jgi:hypothetical protein